MNVEILRISQEVDFEQDVTVSFIHLRLPSGRLLRALIDDDSVQAVVEDKVRFAGAPKPIITGLAPRAHPSTQEEMPPDDLPKQLEEVTEFGGDGGQESTGFEMPALDAPPGRALPSLQRPIPMRPARRIQADESGNPIVPSVGGVNPDDLVPPFGMDGMTPG